VTRSLKTKLLLAIGVPLLTVYVVLAASEYYSTYRDALGDIQSLLTEVAGRQAAELDRELIRAEELAKTLALVLNSSPDLTSDRLQTTLREHLRANPLVFGMTAAFERGAFSPDVEWFAPYYCRVADGQLRFVDIAQVSPDYAHYDWYQPAKAARAPVWSEPYFDTGIGERIMCTFTAPLFRQGDFRGVLTVDLLSEDLLREISPARMESGYCMLISRKGTFVSHPDLSLVMHQSIFGLAERHDLPDLAAAGCEMVAGRAGVRRIRDYQTREWKWMAFAPVDSVGWSLAAVIPEEEIMGPIYAQLFRFLGGLVGGVISILAIIWLMSVRVTRPLARLAAAAQQLAAGNLEVCVSPSKGRDEVSQLTDTFNAMVVNLRSNVEARIREETARREVERDLLAAREVQASLLPAMLPAHVQRGFCLHAFNAPARHVAGDFYDFFFVTPDRLAVVIADVSGKGLPAAMYMAVTRTRLRDYATAQKTPAEVVAELNRDLAQENEREMFVTLFFGYYHLATGELTYVNGGHNPPCLVRREGRLETLEPTGPLVGPLAGATFDNGQCHLDRGDMLVLFTDGVTEANAPEGEMFGEKRLEAILVSSAAEPVAKICDQVIQAARDFSRGDLADDATVLALRRT